MVALKDIAELDETFAATLALFLGFYLIMFMFIEIPLLGYVFAPEQTASRPRGSTTGSTATVTALGIAHARTDRRLHDRARAC